MAREPQSGMKSKSRDRDDDDRRSRRDEDEDRPRKASKARDEEPEQEDGEEEQDQRSTRRGRDRDEEDDRPSKSAKGNGKGSRPRDEDEGDSDDPDAPINLEGADENASGYGEVIPRGKYMCRVDDAEFKEFSTGSKGASIKLEIIEGEFAANGKTRKKGKVLFTNLVCSAAAADILKASLKALGVDKKVYNHPQFRPSMLQRLCDEGDLVGNEVVADVKVGTYQGDKNNQVKRLLHPSAAGGKAEGKGSFLED